MTTRLFSQLDVFTAVPLRGNPLALAAVALGGLPARVAGLLRPRGVVLTDAGPALTATLATPLGTTSPSLLSPAASPGRAARLGSACLSPDAAPRHPPANARHAGPARRHARDFW